MLVLQFQYSLCMPIFCIPEQIAFSKKTHQQILFFFYLKVDIKDCYACVCVWEGFAKVPAHQITSFSSTIAYQ